MALIKPKTQTASGKPSVAHRTTAGSRFTYRPPSAAELKERATRKGSRDSFFEPSIQFFTPKVGDNTVRILPPPPEKRDEWRSYGVTLYVHYGIGADEASYLCLDKMRGEACPICEERARAKAEGEEDLANDLRATQRIAIYVVDRDQEGKGPLIWNMPQTIDADICGRSVDKKTGEIYAVDDPSAGYDVTFTREGQAMTTKYKSIDIERRPSPLSEDDTVASRWLEHVCANPIDGKLVYHDYPHIKNALIGAASTAPAEGGNETTPTEGTKPRIALRGKTKPPEPATKGNGDKPTYEELLQMNEDEIGGLAEEFKLQFPEDQFDSLEKLQTWTAQQLEIEPPPPPETTSAKQGWRARLRSAADSK